jgi:NADH-quinone oxidoreductase subunit J
MTPLQIVFLLTAAGTLGAALMVVTSRRVLHSALYLVATLFGVAVVFAILQAGFFAVAQVIVYIGAITMLIIFAVMLTRQVMNDKGPQNNYLWWAGAGAALVVFGGLAGALLSWSPFRQPIGELDSSTQTAALLGQALVSPTGYVIPFEVASILLLASLIGAIYIARDRKAGEDNQPVEGREA